MLGFLIRIMILKDNADDKVLENKFYKRETKEKIERIKCCKFVIICRTYLKKSVRKTKLFVFRSFRGLIEILVECSAFVKF